MSGELSRKIGSWRVVVREHEKKLKVLRIEIAGIERLSSEEFKAITLERLRRNVREIEDFRVKAQAALDKLLSEAKLK